MIKYILLVFLLTVQAAMAGNFAADNFIANKSVEYFDPAGGGFDVKMQAPTLAAGWTLTLPTTAGSNLQCLQTNGSGVTSWASPTGGITIGAFGSTPNANGLSYSDPTLNMQPADATHPGGVSTAAQTIPGAKTFPASTTFSVAGVSGLGAALLSGAPYNGGTATTNKPLLWLEWGSPISTNWDATASGGTALGINAASGFAGKLITAQVNGVNAFNVSPTAVFVGAGATALNTYATGFVCKGTSGDGCELDLQNANGNGPALFRMGNNGAFTILDSGKVIVQSDTTGDVAFAAGAPNGPANLDTVIAANQTNATTHNTFAAQGIASQTGDLFTGYASGSSTKLFRIKIDGSGTFANLTDAALGAGVVRSDSSGNFTSAEISGDGTTSGSNALTLATVNGSPGTTAISTITTNGKGLVTSNSAASTTGSGSVVLATGPTMTNPVVGTQASGDNSTKAASTAFVQAALAQLNPAAAVYAASTATIAGTYTNAVGGVCVADTFTTTATTAFALDSVSPPVGSRVLLKDQSSGFQNGVWTLTTQAVGGVSGAVLTRALDWDSASDMNAGNLVPVINGTTNASTVWFQTATITTCNSDSQVFTKFIGNGGTVTSVAETVPAFLSISGSPITSSGTLALSYSGTPLPVAQTTVANQALTTCTTARTIDWSTGNSFTLTLTSGNACTLTFSNAVSGQTIVIWITNGGSGGTATLVWPTAKWFPAGAPVMTTGTSALDVYTCTYNGTSYACNGLQNGG